MSEYDAADSQIKTGVMAREAAADLESAITWLKSALDNVWDGDDEELQPMIDRLEQLYVKYHDIGEML